VITQALRTYLLTKTGITDLIGTGGNARIYKDKIPQKNTTWPVLTYRTVSTQQEHDLSGACGMARPRIQLDCWHETSVGAEALAEAVRNALDGYTGAMGSATVSVALLEDTQDFYRPNEDGSDNGVHQISLDFQIIHLESVPTL
jgi:hypothetical protein